MDDCPYDFKDKLKKPKLTHDELLFCPYEDELNSHWA